MVFQRLNSLPRSTPSATAITTRSPSVLLKLRAASATASWRRDSLRAPEKGRRTNAPSRLGSDEKGVLSTSTEYLKNAN